MSAQYNITDSYNIEYKVVYDNISYSNLEDGDLYFDTRDGKYYVFYSMGSVELFKTDSSVSTLASNYVNYNTTASADVYSEKYNRSDLKYYLKNNPDLLDELLIDLRNEKITKIKEKLNK